MGTPIDDELDDRWKMPVGIATITICVGVVLNMIVGILEPRYALPISLTNSLGAIAAAFYFASIVRRIVRWFNRRDEQFHQKPPPDAP